MTDAVWVEHSFGTECIRYYPSPGIRIGQRAIIFFDGDWISDSLGRGLPPMTTEGLYAFAKRQAEQWQMPFIYVARPGLYGSSGDYTQRRRPKEFYTLNAALDAIKRRYQMGRIVLTGQSGGGTVAMALLTLGRIDVDCAVAAAGNYSPIEQSALKLKKIGVANVDFDDTGYTDPYDVSSHVDVIPSDSARRLFVIADPADRIVYIDLQKRFADQIRDLGHHVVLLEGQGEGPDKHDLLAYANAVAGWCAAGLSDAEIAERAAALRH